MPETETDHSCAVCGKEFEDMSGGPEAIKWETGHGVDKWICPNCAFAILADVGMVTTRHYCYGCAKSEIQYPHTFRVCFECKHVYETAKDLIDMYNKEGRRVHAKTFREEGGFEMGEWKDKTKVKDIHFCPVCLHDF